MSLGHFCCVQCGDIALASAVMNVGIAMPAHREQANPKPWEKPAHKRQDTCSWGDADQESGWKQCKTEENLSKRTNRHISITHKSSHTHTHKHTQMQTLTHTHKHTYPHMCPYIDTHTFIHTNALTHPYAQRHTQARHTHLKIRSHTQT